MLTHEFPIVPQFSDSNYHRWMNGKRRLTIYTRTNEYFKAVSLSTIESGVIGEGDTLEGLFTWLTETQPVIQDQPPPKVSDRPCIQDLAIADLQERKAIGIQRYGTALQPFNGRNPLVDLYQELQDALVYTRQELFEREELIRRIDEAIAAYEATDWESLEVAIGRLKDLRNEQAK